MNILHTHARVHLGLLCSREPYIYAHTKQARFTASGLGVVRSNLPQRPKSAPIRRGMGFTRKDWALLETDTVQADTDMVQTDALGSVYANHVTHQSKHEHAGHDEPARKPGEHLPAGGEGHVHVDDKELKENVRPVASSKLEERRDFLMWCRNAVHGELHMYVVLHACVCACDRECRDVRGEQQDCQYILSVCMHARMHACM
jgi:hypothetical protein